METLITSSMAAGDRPYALPISMASAVPSTVSAVARLLTVFMAWPLPTGPRWKTCCPMSASSGRTRFRVAAWPPHMKTSVALSAPSLAPETGASIMATSRSASRAAVSRVSQGSAEEVSTRIAPRAKPSARPSQPKTHSRTAMPSGSIVNTTSEASATSRGVRTARAPLWRRATFLAAAGAMS